MREEEKVVAESCVSLTSTRQKALSTGVSDHVVQRRLDTSNENSCCRTRLARNRSRLPAQGSLPISNDERGNVAFCRLSIRKMRLKTAKREHRGRFSSDILHRAQLASSDTTELAPAVRLVLNDMSSSAILQLLLLLARTDAILRGSGGPITMLAALDR